MRRPGQVRMPPAADAWRSVEHWHRADALRDAGGGGFPLGVDGAGVMRFAGAEENLLLIAQARTGHKSSGLVIPAVHMSPGPIVVTSTRLDVLEPTWRVRSRRGRVWVLDPLGDETDPVLLAAGARVASHDPTDGCWTYDASLQSADQMTRTWQSLKGLDGDGWGYWTAEGRNLLALLMYAARLAGLGVSRVMDWLNTPWHTVGDMADPCAWEPLQILVTHGAEDGVPAAELLQLVERARGDSTPWDERVSIVKQVLETFRTSAARRIARAEAPGSERFDPAAFAGSDDVLYIVSPAKRQRMYAPVVVDLLLRIMDCRFQLTRSEGRGARSQMWWILDEASQICPIPDLMRILAECGGSGLSVAVVLQSFTQLEALAGAEAGGWRGVFHSVLIGSGLADADFLRTVENLYPDVPRTRRERSTGRTPWIGLPTGDQDTTRVEHEPAVKVSHLAGIPPGHVHRVDPTRSPELLRLVPHWEDPWPRLASLPHPGRTLS